MRVLVLRTLMMLASKAHRIEREIDCRDPLTPEWGGVLRSVRIAARELDEAVAILKQNVPQ